MTLNKIFAITILLGVLIVSLVSAGEWTSDLNDGLVSYYDFNNNTLDIYGNNHGVNHGINYVDGVFDNGLSFDGIDDYVDVADDDSLDLNNFSFSLWFKADYQMAGYLINKGQNNNADNISYRVYLVHLDSGTGDYVITGDVFTYEDGREWFESLYPTNEWNHIVFVYDGINQVAYLNGIEVDRILQSGMTRVTDTSLLFGARLFGDQTITHYEGLMDEVGVWNRALTNGEVIQLWNDGVGIKYNVFETEPNIEERLEILKQKVEELESRTSWLESMIDKIVDFVGSLPKGLSKRFGL